MRSGWVAIGFLCAIGITSAAIRIDNFAAPSGIRLVGDAAVSRDKALRLTPSRPNRSGAAWLIEKQRVALGFDTTFEFRMTNQGGLGHGADGFAFVLQNSGPTALGGRGSAGGFAVADENFHPREGGIPWSIAVFFDTYRNEVEGDPSANYIAVRAHGKPAEMRWPADRLASTPDLNIQLKDRRIHSARILFQTPVLQVFLDGSATPVLETTVDLSLVVDLQQRAWVGFTASTGGGYQNHDILKWSFEESEVSSTISLVSSQIRFLMSACLPEKNLCTPERAVIERRGAGYHVILPANLPWGVAIPNPHERPVQLTNAHGMACWDLKGRGSGGCSGPSGNAQAAGEGFLVLDAPPGGLVIKTRERITWCSVNGRSDMGFKNNEGFYEFDLEFK